MKRLVALGVLVVALTACSTVDNNFHVDNGVCYRTRTSHTMGIQTHKETIAAVPENCGLPPTTAP